MANNYCEKYDFQQCWNFMWNILSTLDIFIGMIIWKLPEKHIMQPEQDILCCKSENGKC